MVTAMIMVVAMMMVMHYIYDACEHDHDFGDDDDGVSAAQRQSHNTYSI